MATPFSTLVRNTLAIVGIGDAGIAPNLAGSPEEDSAPPPLGQMVSRSPELQLGGAFYAGLAQNDDSILIREGSQNLKLYDRLLDDDVAFSTLQQRRLAITARDWEVTPGDDKDPNSVAAADDFRAMLDGIGFDRVTNLLHYAIWFGYSVGEAIYTTRIRNGRRLIWLDSIVVPDRRWFGFTVAGELRLASTFGVSLAGEALPPNKFISLKTGGSHDFSFYGLGLAHWAYWPVWFKKAATGFWALYLEKLASPTAVGEFTDAMSEKERGVLLQALLAIGQDSAVLLPQGAGATVKFMEATRPGASGSSFKEFMTEQNDALMRVILGQTGTSKSSPQGIGSGQADVHEDVKREIVKADADLICDALNTTVAEWLTRWNYGLDVAPPKVFRVLDDGEDMNSIAERDVKLKSLGFERTEDSFAQVYGEGYEKVIPPPPPPIMMAPGARPGIPANENTRQAAADKRAQFDASDPRPLYVRRDVTNTAALAAWAKGQGLTLDPGADVTVLYSKAPVDWFAMGEEWGSEKDGGIRVRPGGPRAVEEFGDKGAIVLRFASDDLRYRHDRLVNAGGSHDFGEYSPHVTITYQPGADLSAIEPYQGELLFGPEIFEEIRTDPTPMFSADEEGAIERLTVALADETNPVLREFAASIKDTIAAAKADADGKLSLEGARVALLQAFERFEPSKLATLTGLAFVATRAASEAGAEGDLTA